jgi:hypothetical protein
MSKPKARKMKRWAVFSDVDYYPNGGMSDFIAVFDTEQQAQAFIARSLQGPYTYEDMENYLCKPSPDIPSEKEFTEMVKAREIRTAEHSTAMTSMEREIDTKIRNATRSLAQSLYGDADGK